MKQLSAESSQKSYTQRLNVANIILRTGLVQIKARRYAYDMHNKRYTFKRNI